MLERKNFSVSQFKAAGDTPGQFEALVSVFNNIDRMGDRMVKGAFQRTLQERGLPPIYHSHQWQDGPIGYTIEAEERDEGLWIKGQLFTDLNDPYVNRLYAGMKTTGPKEFSFAYEVRDSKEITEDSQTIRELSDVELFEVGPTLVGMNPETELLQVASANFTSSPNVTVTYSLDGKAGRVLSGKNEDALKQAHELIGAVLKQLEKQEEDDESEEEADDDGKSGDTDTTIRKQRAIEIFSMTRHKEVA